jgi:hypothetical protein
VAALPVQAQDDPGAICVLTFADANKNGIREEGEAALANTDVSLKQNNVVLSNLVIDEKTGGELCFRNLSAGLYVVTFSNPFAQASTPATFDFTVRLGDTLRAEFGAAPQLQVDTPTSGNLSIPLTRPVRIGMALGGALLVMGFMTGLGLFLRNLPVLRRGGKPRRDVRAASRG